MPDDPATPVSFGMLEDVLGFRMQRLRSVLSGQMVAGMKHWGLRRGAFMVLALVQDNPGISQTVLVRETGIRKTLLVALLHELEDRALIVRQTRASDRRHNQLFVTDAGREIVSAMADLVARVEAPIRAALSDEALAQLKAALDQAFAAASSAIAPGPPPPGTAAP